MKRKKHSAKRWRKYRQPKATPVHFVRLRLPRVEIAPGRKWFVVRTLPRMDQRVAEELQALGAETYVPVLVEERVRRGRRELSIRNTPLRDTCSRAQPPLRPFQLSDMWMGQSRCSRPMAAPVRSNQRHCNSLPIF
jgi:hypothetical protein